MRPFILSAALAVFVLSFLIVVPAQAGTQSAQMESRFRGNDEKKEPVPPPLHGVAMHGQPKYKAGFAHLDYVNPDAPKGGTLRLGAVGTFDSLNGFILKGVPAPGIEMLYQPLMGGTSDEAFSAYGEIAQSIEIPDDRSFVVFNLRPEATWHDGKPITADDVVWTFNALLKDGHPYYRAYYGHVKEAKAESPARVRFTFDMKGNRELPLIMGQMTVLPKHDWEGRNFAATTLKPPLGSGAYRVKSVEPGRRITYERVRGWWASTLPLNKGMNNFDEIVYDLFRDHTVLLEALFSGNYDFRVENRAKSWATEYDARPAVKQGLLKKAEIRYEQPAGMQAFIFNIRRPVFSEKKVREALNHAFDFEWSNKSFAYGAYKRTKSYFENSELASTGLPEGRELRILDAYRDKLPPELFTTPFTLPQTDGSGNVRGNLLKAKKLLADAGWTLGASGLLEKDGTPFKIEFLYDNEQFEPWIQALVANLKKLGVGMTLRFADTAQYQNRMDGHDFDMTIHVFGQSLSPGNEQRNFWGSDKADMKGTGNLIGIKDPVVDDLIEKIVSAPDRDELVARARALDRVLLWGWYVIPNWYIDFARVAYWDKFGKPAVTPRYGTGAPGTWWYDPAKAAKVAGKIKPAEKK